MKTISPAQRGAVEEALRLGLTDLAASILEKDLLITDVLGLLADFDWGDVQPVFCGGTSLSKGHGVLERMSEDIDFKLVLPEGWSRSLARRQLSELRERLVDDLRQAGFDLPEEGITALNENRYVCLALGYAPQFPLAAALRAELRLDFTVHAPLLEPVSVEVQSLLTAFMPLNEQAIAHWAVAMPETLVEKVVSFLRRTAGWPEQLERNPDDEQLVRHLYDVYQLQAVLPSSAQAPAQLQPLFNQTVAGDREKFGRQQPDFGRVPGGWLQKALVQLQTSGELEELYERFVGELVWGPPVPFSAARDCFCGVAEELLAGLELPP
jgi:predicted nucleotidyltransferase component of viral defense system